MTKDLNITLRRNQKLSVLLVDDEPEIRETLRMFLEMTELFTFIVEASNGSEALQKCQVQQFDLIITDLNMPKVGGNAFIRNLKTYQDSQKIKKQVPIVILSANVTSQEVRSAVDFGVKNVLTKPCTAESFIEKIQGVLVKEHRDKLLIKKPGSDDDQSSV